MAKCEYGSLTSDGKRWMVRMKGEGLERLELLATDFGGTLWTASFLLTDVLDMLVDLRPDRSTLLGWLRQTCREGKLSMMNSNSEVLLQARVALGAGMEVQIRLPPEGSMDAVAPVDAQKLNAEIAFALLEQVNAPLTEANTAAEHGLTKIGKDSNPGSAGEATPPQKRSRVDDCPINDKALPNPAMGRATASSPIANIGQVKVVNGRRGPGRGRGKGKGAMKIGDGS